MLGSRKVLIAIAPLLGVASSAFARGWQETSSVALGADFGQTQSVQDRSANLSIDHPLSSEGHDELFKNWMFRNLNDPDSAKWRRYKDAFKVDVVLRRGVLGKKKWSGYLACYTMNAKNGYGAYAGYSEYALLINESGDYIVWQGMSESEKGGLYRSWDQQLIDNYCRS